MCIICDVKPGTLYEFFCITSFWHIASDSPVLISVAQTCQLNWEKEHACLGVGRRECATFCKTFMNLKD